jgi:hypothetical protein
MLNRIVGRTAAVVLGETGEDEVAKLKWAELAEWKGVAYSRV